MVELTKADQAWNALVMSDPDDFEEKSIHKHAALASHFMGQVHNGGYNYSLSYSSRWSTLEIAHALETIGATAAKTEFENIINLLGGHLPKSNTEQREIILGSLRTSKINQFDLLSDKADASLHKALEQHVSKNIDFYLGLNEE